MVNENFSNKLNHYILKLEFVRELLNKNLLRISYDRLKVENEVEQELLYFVDDGEEKKGLFLFSYDYFLKELNDSEFKKILGKNMLNLLILNSFMKLKKKVKNDENIKINDIVEDIVLNYPNFSYLSKGKILKRILTLVYYHNWKIQRDDDSIDSNYAIDIPNDFGKMKQRFNLESSVDIFENDLFLFFLNMKGDLCFVFKELKKFTKKDIAAALDVLRTEFDISEFEFVD